MVVRELRHTFPAAPRGLLRISTCGSIELIPGEPEEEIVLAVRYEVGAAEGREPGEILRDLAVTFASENGNLTFTAKYAGLRRKDDRIWPPARAHVIATVPAGCSADLESGGEGVQVGDLTGSVQVRSGGGPVRLGRMGGSVVAATSGGNLVLSAAAGPVELRTDGGRIDAGTLAGPATLETSGVAVRVALSGTPVRATTGGGTFQATLRGREGGSLITAGDGSVQLQVLPAAGFDLDACGSSVTVAIPGAETAGRRQRDGKLRVRGRLRGGGLALTIRADAIRLEGAE